MGRTDLAGNDYERFCRALATRLWDLTPEVVVFPGHMGSTTIAEEKETNWLFEDYVRHARGEPAIPRRLVGIQIDLELTGPGLLLTAVTEGSPAATAGLLPGDVVRRFAGTDMGTIEDMLAVLRRCAVGDRVPLEIERDGERLGVLMVLGTRPR